MYNCPLCRWVSVNKDEAKALKEREFHLRHYHGITKDELVNKANPEQSGRMPCPQCGSTMTPQSGCWLCQACGFDKCG